MAENFHCETAVINDQKTQTQTSRVSYGANLKNQYCQLVLSLTLSSSEQVSGFNKYVSYPNT